MPASLFSSQVSISRVAGYTHRSSQHSVGMGLCLGLLEFLCLSHWKENQGAGREAPACTSLDQTRGPFGGLLLAVREQRTWNSYQRTGGERGVTKKNRVPWEEGNVRGILPCRPEHLLGVGSGQCWGGRLELERQRQLELGGALE